MDYENLYRCLRIDDLNSSVTFPCPSIENSTNGLQMRNLAILCALFMSSLTNCFGMPNLTPSWQMIFRNENEDAKKELAFFKISESLTMEEYLHVLMMEVIIDLNEDDQLSLKRHLDSIRQLVYLEHMSRPKLQAELVQTGQELMAR